MGFDSLVTEPTVRSRFGPNSGAVLGGVQGVRIQTGTLDLIGGWSRELERCTTALLLAESVRLNVEAERGIYGTQQRGKTRVTFNGKRINEDRKKTDEEKGNLQSCNLQRPLPLNTHRANANERKTYKM